MVSQIIMLQLLLFTRAVICICEWFRCCFSPGLLGHDAAKCKVLLESLKATNLTLLPGKILSW